MEERRVDGAVDVCGVLREEGEAREGEFLGLVDCGHDPVDLQYKPISYLRRNRRQRIPGAAGR